GHCQALALAREGTGTDLLAALGDQLPMEATDPAAADTAGRARRALTRWRSRLDRLDPEAVLDDAGDRGIRVIVPGDEEWPDPLAHRRATGPHCPWRRGRGRLDDRIGPRHAALVGSRASTPYGEDTASSLAAAFAAGGGTVVSGGAYGIDAAAHRGALAAEDRATLVVRVEAGGHGRRHGGRRRARPGCPRGASGPTG